jgi:hypothetical protein
MRNSFRREFETERYVFNIWVDTLESAETIRVTVRLSREERHRRQEETITVEEMAEQIKNIEKWITLIKARKLLTAA